MKYLNRFRKLLTRVNPDNNIAVRISQDKGEENTPKKTPISHSLVYPMSEKNDMGFNLILDRASAGCPVQFM